MIIKDDYQFVEYWELRRGQKMKIRNFLYIGLPFIIFAIMAVCINIFTGWYTKATMLVRMDASLWITLMVAFAIIIIFVCIFTIKHQWEQYEQRYQEILNKKKI